MSQYKYPQNQTPGIKRVIPPPNFTREQRAMQYRYVQHRNTNVHPGIHQRKKRILYDYVKNFDTIPMIPTSQIVKQLKDYEIDTNVSMTAHLKTLSHLFEIQPIWARAPLLAKIDLQEHVFLRMTLPM